MADLCGGEARTEVRSSQALVPAAAGTQQFSWILAFAGMSGDSGLVLVLYRRAVDAVTGLRRSADNRGGGGRPNNSCAIKVAAVRPGDVYARAARRNGGRHGKPAMEDRRRPSAWPLQRQYRRLRAGEIFRRNDRLADRIASGWRCNRHCARSAARCISRVGGLYARIDSSNLLLRAAARWQHRRRDGHSAGHRSLSHRRAGAGPLRHQRHDCAEQTLKAE